MRVFDQNDYAGAVSYQEKFGGWLLIDGFDFFVCDNFGTVRDMRGQDFIDHCEAHQCWDETKLP